MEVLQQRSGTLNIERLLLIKDNQISQVKEFSVYYSVYEKIEQSRLTEIIHLICSPAILGPVSYLFHSLSSLRAHCKEWLQSDT